MRRGRSVAMLGFVGATAKTWLRKVLCTVGVVVVEREEKFQKITRGEVFIRNGR
jgi:hypothetical protein